MCTSVGEARAQLLLRTGKRHAAAGCLAGWVGASPPPSTLPPPPPRLPQVRSIVGTLLEVLTTPSESVQRGVSDCLPPLMQASRSGGRLVWRCVAAGEWAAAGVEWRGFGQAGQVGARGDPGLTAGCATRRQTLARLLACASSRLAVQALQGDSAFVEGTVQALLQRCLKGANYGDRCVNSMGQGLRSLTPHPLSPATNQPSEPLPPPAPPATSPHTFHAFGRSAPLPSRRRGAAYGLAGAVRGLGISSLRGLGIMDALKAAIEDKGSAEAREGARAGRRDKKGTHAWVTV